MMNITHEPTKDVLKWFEEITKIPRCSKHEEKICQWLLDWAKEHNFAARKDKVGNICISVPASAGFEHAPITVIQGHMDMVCEKTPDSTHDFTRDPIKLVYEGEWLTADRTTLGADNGIAIAMAMALATRTDVKHPPLELLFTVDEETGLTGANSLEPGFIKGKILINVDSEDEGVFTVGCAGGINTTTEIPLKFEAVPAGYEQFRLVSGGMKGGHSGIDIAKEKANAIKILGRTMDELVKKGIDLRLAYIKGGSAHNAIPRDAEAVIFFPRSEEDNVVKIVEDFERVVEGDTGASKYERAATASETRKVIDYIEAIPHGVDAMSTAIKDLVETSNNFANIKIEDNKLKVLTSQRSSVVSRLHAHTSRIEALARLAGGKGMSGDGYPPWQPNMASPLLAKSKALYEKMFNKIPVVEVIHAGLECGIIGDKYPGMDMISIGPDLKYPHSPDEKVNVTSIGKVWEFIIELLKELKDYHPDLA